MRIWLALVTVYLVWGSTFIALAIAVRDLPPFLAMSIRHLVAGIALLLFAIPRGDRMGDPIGRRQIAAAFVFGGLLFVGGHGLLAWAQQTVAAGVAALVVGTIPIWMALFDRVAFGRRLPAVAYLGFAIGFVGLAFLFDPFGETSVDRWGALVIVLSAVCWAIGSIYSRGAPLPKRPLVSAGLASLVRRDPAHRLLGRVRRDRRGDVDERRGACARLSRSWRGASSGSRRTSGCCARHRSRSFRRTRT